MEVSDESSGEVATKMGIIASRDCAASLANATGEGAGALQLAVNFR